MGYVGETVREGEQHRRECAEAEHVRRPEHRRRGVERGDGDDRQHRQARAVGGGADVEHDHVHREHDAPRAHQARRVVSGQEERALDAGLRGEEDGHADPWPWPAALFQVASDGVGDEGGDEQNARGGVHGEGRDWGSRRRRLRKGAKRTQRAHHVLFPGNNVAPLSGGCLSGNTPKWERLRGLEFGAVAP